MSQERRHTFRCKSDSGTMPTEGVLHTRRGDVVVKLENRSSGGFGVLLPKGSDSHVKNEEEIAFSLGGGSSLVRVAHQSPRPEGMVIGLEVLRELPSTMSKNHGKRAAGESSFGGTLLRYGMFAACLVMLVLYVPWDYLLTAAQNGELPEQLVNEVRTGGERLFGSSQQREQETKLASSFFQIDQLRSHSATSRLNLTMSQQRDISQIVQETTSAMEAIFQHRESLGDTEWTELGLQLLQSSARRIEANLTEQQRAEWSGLVNARSGGARGEVNNVYAN